MVLRETNFTGLPLFKKGKVRDVYEADGGLIIVATDRISAFDVVLPTPIPYKGELLNQLSLFWFERFKNLVPNHVITADVELYPEAARPYADALRHRSVYVKKARSLPVECIVRGYISGSGWKEYKRSGEICGIKLDAGLQESDRLPEPLFTPSTKADLGDHDENISFRKMVDLIGAEQSHRLRDLSLALYTAARDYALSRNIIIADTKFEFGLSDDGIILIDEALTPDSSRFWPLETYVAGQSQVSLDKQYIRDYLLKIHWEGMNVLPELPVDVVRNTFLKYKQAFELLTGRRFRVDDTDGR